MTRLAWIWIGLVTACASTGTTQDRRAEHAATFARIAALGDARTDGDGELQQWAQNSDAAVRSRCATALGRLWFPEFGAETTRALLAMLGDQDAGVRTAAAFGLGVRGDPSAADRLMFVALDVHQADPDPLVRARALEAASKLDRPELRERMLDGLFDADARVRLEAAQGASRWPTTDNNASFVNQRLVDALAKESDSDVIAYTLFALERRKASEGFGSFVRYTSSHEAEQRLFAVRGLKALATNPAALGHLWRATTDGDWRVACEGLLGLVDASDDSSAVYIVNATRHSSAHVRRAAWEVAGALAQRDLESLQRLESAGCGVRTTIGATSTDERSSWVVAAMFEAHLRALKYVQQPGGEADQALERLGPVYSSLSREVRVAIARGLAALDEERAVPMLLELAKDPEFVVGETAIEMLAKFPGPVVRGALHEIVGFGDNGIRLAVVLALAEQPDASDLEPLITCYDMSSGDGANEIRFNILRVASKIGGERAVDLMMKGLLDASPFVRRVAREELGKLDSTARERAERLALAASAPVEALELPHFDQNPLVDVITSRGTLRFELFPDETPLHVHNFLKLAERDHYDGTPWHRVVSDFVVQGGDYRGDGNGGGTWLGKDRALRHEITARKYVRGSLGMPRNEDVDSGGSQIFVTHRATPHLDGRYTIFGELRAGFDVLDAIEVGDQILDVRRVPN